MTDYVNENLKKIMASHPELVDDKKGRSLADPWVIAHAIAEKAIVVTTEMLASKKIKIPDVCIDYKVPWIPEFEFAKKIGVRFTAKINE